MSKQKRLDKYVVIRVRQPSFSEGIARIVDFANALGDDYFYPRKKHTLRVIHIPEEFYSIEDSMEALNQDYEAICGDLRNTENKIGKEYQKRLEKV